MWAPVLCVRIADAADIAREGLVDVIVDFDKLTMLPILQAVGIQFPEEKVRLSLSAPHMRLVLLYDGPVLAGYLRFSRHYMDPVDMEIGSVQLLQQYRGGPGFAILVTECARLLRTEEFRSIGAGVHKHNERALRLYRKLGLEITPVPERPLSLGMTIARAQLDSPLIKRLEKAVAGRFRRGSWEQEASRTG